MSELTDGRESIEIVEKMRKTREWISCAEIAAWCARGAASTSDRKDRRSRTFDRLGATFAAGGFRSGGKSQLCILSPDTAVVRLFCKPVDRDRRRRGFRPGSVSAPNYLERCWLPNEMCRHWFRQQKLDWPAHFETMPPTLKEQPKKTAQSADAETRRKRGRPSLSKAYVEEFERRVESQSVCKTLKDQANKLHRWGDENLPKEKHLVVETIENCIRDWLQRNPDLSVPWKSK